MIDPHSPNGTVVEWHNEPYGFFVAILSHITGERASIYIVSGKEEITVPISSLYLYDPTIQNLPRSRYYWDRSLPTPITKYRQTYPEMHKRPKRKPRREY